MLPYLSATMASDESDVEWQTGEIVKCLLENEDEVDRRSMELDINMPSDKPKDDDFDPAVIGEMLRKMGEALGDSAFNAELTDLKKQQDPRVPFSRGVEALRQSQANQSAGMSSEMQLMKATVGFGLYVVKSSPDLKNTVKSAMTAFLNKNLCKWVAEQGGWNKLNI